MRRLLRTMVSRGNVPRSSGPTRVCDTPVGTAARQPCFRESFARRQCVVATLLHACVGEQHTWPVECPAHAAHRHGREAAAYIQFIVDHW
jgi:hypothetical protein